METWISRHRPLLIRLAVLICLPIVLLTHHGWAEDSAIDYTLDDAGAALVVVGVLGRIWCTLSIAGRKNRELVTTGPYSICRNPLYFFTMILVAGLLCVFENVLVVGPVLAVGALTHAASVRREERALLERFGAEYESYVARVPRLLPDPRGYCGATPGRWMPIDKAVAFRGIRDTALMLLPIPIAELIEHLHLSGVLPVLLHC